MKCQRWMLEDTSIKYRFHSWVGIRALRLDSAGTAFLSFIKVHSSFLFISLSPDRVFFVCILHCFLHLVPFPENYVIFFLKKRITLQLSLTFGVCKIRWHFVAGAQISRTCARILSPFYFFAEQQKGFSQNRAQIFHYSGEKWFEKLVHKSQYYSC